MARDTKRQAWWGEAVRAYKRLRAIDAKYDLWPGRASDHVGIQGATDLVSRGDLIAIGIWQRRLWRVCEEAGADLRWVLQVIEQEAAQQMNDPI